MLWPHIPAIINFCLSQILMFRALPFLMKHFWGFSHHIVLQKLGQGRGATHIKIRYLYLRMMAAPSISESLTNNPVLFPTFPNQHGDSSLCLTSRQVSLHFLTSSLERVFHTRIIAFLRYITGLASPQTAQVIQGWRCFYGRQWAGQLHTFLGTSLPSDFQALALSF